MIHRFLLSILFLCISTTVLRAQDKEYTRHTVTKGETITQIATKYKITPYDIYKLNPDAQKGIKENDLILIPVPPADKKEVSVVAEVSKAGTGRTHIAKPKETLYSISRDYDVNVEDLKALNATSLVNGLKIGQTIRIPDAGASTSMQQPKDTAPNPVSSTATTKQEVVSANKGTEAIVHVVQPKETKFGIAKKYGMTVQELEQRNPEIVDNLPIGFHLNINGAAPKKELSKSVAEKPVVEKPKPVTTEIVQDEIVETKTIRTLTKNGYANYEVKSGDTMYSLTQYFKVTEAELLALNPTLKEGVKLGMILKVPGKGTIKTDTEPMSNHKVVSRNVQSNTDKKQLVLLLPFNVQKIESDSVKTMDIRLKKDAFLNMTLDFYAGALIAIDSAKTLGLNVDVKILDSEESKISSNIANLVKDHKLDEADAVIGPFYQQYAEQTAALLAAKNVPVISPLSKESGKPFPNLFQAMPSTDYGKKAVLRYLQSKNGNIVVVSDPKRVYNKDFIAKNCPAAKFVTLLDNGALDAANLKSLLVKGVPNFVIMESERTGLILGTTNVLLNELANYQIQLVIIEPNETLDFEEVSMKRLTILKLLYPSLTKENNSVEATHFEKKYKELNKVFPNQYATRGFDLTFDTLVRITQSKSFIASANEEKSEQVESKFEYSKNGTDGYSNQGIFIMEYQDDLTVKQVN